MSPPAATLDDAGLQFERQGPVAYLWLDRPAARNALDGPLVAALTRWIMTLGEDAEVRVIVLGGRGPAFCAGADLAWMERLGTATMQENLADALRLAELFRVLHECPRPTIARVHGACYGGGIGLVAACDIALANTGARFSLAEARLGVLPATIGPHVLRAIGARASSRYMLTAEAFDGLEAVRLGLAHEAVDAPGLDAAVDRIVDALLAGGPQAQSGVKRLIRELAGRPLDDSLLHDTARRIAEARASPEGREGLAAMLGKRRPDWSSRRADPPTPRSAARDESPP
jgi:methylglutaconyl-CoA hydratase